MDSAALIYAGLLVFAYVFLYLTRRWYLREGFQTPTQMGTGPSSNIPKGVIAIPPPPAIQ